MEGLNLDNILDDDSIALFGEDENEETQEEETEDTPEENENEQDNTAEVDPDNLFGDGPESVGSEDEDIEAEEDTPPSEGDSTSPKKTDFFSSIAEAFAEEGILPNLDEETIKGIKTAEDFREAINDYIKSELNDTQRRIQEALQNDVQPDVIKQYEGTIHWLQQIDDATIAEESDQSEDLRKRIIYQDYINRGFDPKRAEKEVNKSIQNGTDVDDAKEALKGCLDFYTNGYNTVLQKAKEEKESFIKQREQEAKKVKEAIMSSKNNEFFGDLDLDKKTREKVFESIAKPIYRDEKTGELFTAIQKYERDNSTDFIVKVGLLYTLTDGFKSLDKLVGGKVKKGIKRGLKDLESKLSSSSYTGGNLKFMSGVDDNTYIGKGIKLAL